MNDRVSLGRQALRGALSTRRVAGIPKDEPICVFDFAPRLGVDLWFTGGSSFSGMYSKTSKTILVPALRPVGYQAFSCAHELGHWYFGHGDRVDELDTFDLASNDDPEEVLANLYAGYLLMPSWAVERAFRRRKWSESGCSPFHAYVVATQLGVGYRALVQHLRWSLHSISASESERLLKSSPKQIRESLLGPTPARHLVVADEAWATVAVDLQVGDAAILPHKVQLEGNSVRAVAEQELGVVVEAHLPGKTRAVLKDESWATFIRVCRKEYHGPSEYRHWEDPDVNDNSESHK